MELVENAPGYKNLDRLAAQTISICTKVDFNIPVGEEEVNVCKAIEDMKEEVRNEGILTAVSMLKDMNLSKDGEQQLVKSPLQS